MSKGSVGPPPSQPRPTVEIPVHVHVVNQGPGFENGDVSQEQIDQQLAHLNDAYEPWGFQFTKASQDRTTNKAWHEATDTQEYRDMKAALHQGGANELNLYIAGLNKSPMPWDQRTAPLLDGVSVRATTLPGNPVEPTAEGDVAVHEVGHWLGLFHTFQGKCGKPGDEIDDTPATQSRRASDPVDRDTCPAQPGKDPAHNFMGYGDDPVTNEFTPDQAERMHQHWEIYRKDGGGPSASVTKRNEQTLVPGGAIESVVHVDKEIPFESMKLELGLMSQSEIERTSIDGPPPPSEDLVVTVTSPSGKTMAFSDREPGSPLLSNGFEISQLFQGERTEGPWKLRIESVNPNGMPWKLFSWGLTLAASADGA